MANPVKKLEETKTSNRDDKPVDSRSGKEASGGKSSDARDSGAGAQTVDGTAQDEEGWMEDFWTDATPERAHSSSSTATAASSSKLRAQKSRRNDPEKIEASSIPAHVDDGRAAGLHRRDERDFSHPARNGTGWDGIVSLGRRLFLVGEKAAAQNSALAHGLFGPPDSSKGSLSGTEDSHQPGMLVPLLGISSSASTAKQPASFLDDSSDVPMLAAPSSRSSPFAFLSSASAQTSSIDYVHKRSRQEAGVDGLGGDGKENYSSGEASHSSSLFPFIKVAAGGAAAGATAVNQLLGSRSSANLLHIPHGHGESDEDSMNSNSNLHFNLKTSASFSSLAGSAGEGLHEGAHNMEMVIASERDAGFFSSMVHKVMEVVPVLLVVTLAVLGTVVYLMFSDQAWGGKPRGALSLELVGEGHWVASPSERPLYSSSCPFIRDAWNCAKYGLFAIDTWGWEPEKCILPTFSAHEFLRTMAGKSIAFVGDELASNAFDSFVCMLAEEEEPLASKIAQIAISSSSTRPGTSLGNVQKDGGGNGAQKSLESDEGSNQAVSVGTSAVVEGAASGQGIWGGLDDIGLGWVYGHGRGRAGSQRRQWNESAAYTFSSGASDSSSSGEQFDKAFARGAERAIHTIDAMTKLEYWFPSHNLTLAFLPSEFLVRTDVQGAVNSSLCQHSQSASAINAQLQQLSVFQNSTFSRENVGPSRNGSASGAGVAAEAEAEAVSAIGASECYPNKVVIDEPDPTWAREASRFDVLMMSSGVSWREEEVERRGLGIFSGEGQRLQGYSMEGLVGQWAYPRAMAAVVSWLQNSSNFAGHTFFRSYVPAHMRRECAARLMLLQPNEALESVRDEEFSRYNDAIIRAVSMVGGQQQQEKQQPEQAQQQEQKQHSRHQRQEELQHQRVRFLNVSLLSAERADAHPWMASPKRPHPDCRHWCLPGVPDTWNEILSATLLQIYGIDHPIRSVVRKELVRQQRR